VPTVRPHRIDVGPPAPAVRAFGDLAALRALPVDVGVLEAGGRCVAVATVRALDDAGPGLVDR
jgi:hypothetical protein